MEHSRQYKQFSGFFLQLEEGKLSEVASIMLQRYWLIILGPKLVAASLLLGIG